MSRNVTMAAILVVSILIAGAHLPALTLAREPEPAALVEIRWPEPAALSVIEDTGVTVYARLSDDRGLYLPRPIPLRAASRAGSVPSIVSPDLRVQAMIDAVDSSILSQYTGDLSGEWPAQVGGQPYTIATRFTNSGTPIHQATQYVGERLANLGLAVEYHTWQAGRPPNVIGELPGPPGSDQILMITAHLDSTTYDTPMTLAPGADDNASGSVAVLTAAEILSQYPWGCTLRFAFWTGEEQGLLGSHAYALRSYNAGEPIQGVLNLDMIAWNTPGSPRDIDLHADQYGVPASMELAQLFADVVDVYNLDLIPDIVPSGTGASDHASFWEYDYNAILAIEDFGDFNDYYHSNDDTLDHLDLSYYTDFVKAAVATFAHMGCLAQGAIAGHVTDVALGTPLAASLRLTGTLGLTYELTTDAAGYYTQTVLPDTYAVVVTAPGYDPDTNSGVVVGQGTTIHDVALDLAGPGYGGIAGHVTDAESGAPLAATVSLATTSGLTYTLTADADGYYRRLLVSDTYTVTATAPAYTPTTASGIVVTTAVVTRDLLLPPFHRLQVAPGFLNHMLDPGQQVSITLWITNPTPAIVDWSLHERPGLGRGDVAWLDVAPAMGTLAPGQAAMLIATLSAEELPPDLYTATVVFSVSRSGWAETRLPVILGVATHPAIYYLPLVMRGR